MIFSYNWLQSFFEKKLPKPEKLADLLSRHFAEVEEVRKEGKDFVLDIDVRPNRAGDCFSHLGIAREIAAITNLTFGIPTSEIKEDKEIKARDFVSVEVKDKTACPRYTAGVVTDVKVASSPKWLQERLEVCGLQPINNIVDIANYVMLETGQPIHAFDLDKVKKRIIVRRAKKGEKIKALDDKTYQLDKDILVIADEKEPIGIAGIKGGQNTAIGSKTKNIIIETANFDRRIIRQGSQKMKLRTDASWRFEHGIDPNLIDFAQKRVASLIQEISHPQGGYPIIAQGMIDFYPKKNLPKKIKLDIDYANNLLGIEISKQKIIKILKSLEFEVNEQKTKNKEQLLVTIPTRRLDISIQEDLIEEIGRIYGYQEIPSTFPISILIPPKRNLEIFWEDLSKNILKEAGFNEVYNYSFLGQKECDTFKFKNPIEIENPISADFQYLRPSLIPNLLKNVATNQKFFKEIKIFELGKVFTLRQAQGKKKEKRMLTGVMTGDAFYQIKGIVDLLLNKLGISNIWYDDYEPTPEESHLSLWQPKKCAEIKIDYEEIGFLGEISQKILETLKIGGKVVIFDLNFEKLQKIASEEHEYRPISKYPAAIRDLAVLVPQGTKVVEVLNKINRAGGKLVRDVDLFDIYSGEEIAQGKENFAFHIIYQAEDRTLSSKEIDKIHRRIIRALEKNPQWEVRR